jgi:FkbH-like protein
MVGHQESKPSSGKAIKCVVWDLDDTLWHGILLEEEVRPRSEVAEVMRALDERGILQSIASRNDHDLAMARLSALGLAGYFVCPQISWGPKSAAVKEIARLLNLGIDSIAFVDDQPFEREEVRFTHPEVLCLDGSSDLRSLLELPRMQPRFMTDEQKYRRVMYQQEFERKKAEETFEGTAREFLATLKMVLRIGPATEGDLERLEELTERTHQLNSTGYTYGLEELDRLRCSPQHVLLVAELSDRFGQYGKIGLALVDRSRDPWGLKLLIVSCRVMARGVGSILLQHVMQRAHDAGVVLQAEFRDTGRNRAMRVAYRFAGFQEVERRGELSLFEHRLDSIPPVPDYVKVVSATVEQKPDPGLGHPAGDRPEPLS